MSLSSSLTRISPAPVIFAEEAKLDFPGSPINHEGLPTSYLELHRSSVHFDRSEGGAATDIRIRPKSIVPRKFSLPLSLSHSR